MSGQKRFDQIDILKGLAIISVIVQHSLTGQQRDYIGGPFYIYQAVPIFMILAGFNGIGSYERRNCRTLGEIYNWGFISPKLSRLLVPYCLTFIIELGWLVGFLHMGARQIFNIFLTGGYGPGSYFLPIMLQITVILPIIYFCAKRNVSATLTISFIIGICFEIYAYFPGMPSSIYRLLFLRYLFAVTLGVWLATRKSQSNILLWIGSLLSVVYIYSVHYASLIPPFQADWQSQNTPSFFYPLLLVILALKFLPQTLQLRFQRVTVIGKASYHIFLTQMVYFTTVAGSISKRIGSTPMSAIINIVLCLVFGTVFYYCEKIFKSRFLKV